MDETLGYGTLRGFIFRGQVRRMSGSWRKTGRNIALALGSALRPVMLACVAGLAIVVTPTAGAADANKVLRLVWPTGETGFDLARKPVYLSGI